MDKVIECRCGNRKWIIGTAGIRCDKCQNWIPPEIFYVRDSQVDASNRYMTHLKKGHGKRLSIEKTYEKV